MYDKHYNIIEPNFKGIEKQFKDAGYKLPKLVFWNLMSRNLAIPMISNENGVALLSGFSPSAIKMGLSGSTNPYDALVDILNSPRYELVEQVLKA